MIRRSSILHHRRLPPLRPRHHHPHLLAIPTRLTHHRRRHLPRPHKILHRLIRFRENYRLQHIHISYCHHPH